MSSTEGHRQAMATVMGIVDEGDPAVAASLRTYMHERMDPSKADDDLKHLCADASRAEFHRNGGDEDGAQAYWQKALALFFPEEQS